MFELACVGFDGYSGETIKWKLLNTWTSDSFDGDW